MKTSEDPPKNRPKEITQSQLIQAVSDANKNGSCVKYGFILGAGASVKSGIPSGEYFAKQWFKEIKTLIENDALESWKASIEGFDENNLAASYTKLFDKRFEVDYRLGSQELQHYMDKANPSIGYSFLAQVLAKTANKFVITTNFDTMSEDALFDLKEAKPLVLGHELLSGFINNSPTRPTIVKVHRDFLLHPYNSDSQTERMDEPLQKALAPVLQENAMIVIGYGGNDESLMGYLKATENRKPIYWCYRDKKKLSERIKQLLNQSDFLIKIESFDQFMLLLSEQLGFTSLVDREDIHNSEIVQSALERAKRYVTQLKELGEQKGLGEEEQAAIKKLLPSWWAYELEVQQETDSDEKNRIYCEGLKAYPKSHELMGNYAVFLSDIRKEYDKAEKFYRKACKLGLKSVSYNINYARYNANYACFLSGIRKEYDKAEELYRKSLELEPDEAGFNGNYALFLSGIRKEYDKAEGFYRKALKLEPKSASNNGNYANFLRTIRKEYDKAEGLYRKSLELEPKSASNNGNYASFLSDIRKEYDKAEKLYRKALELEPESANNNSNYASFLSDIRKEYDKAEIFYRKSLELEPENAALNSNYAQFLLVIIGQKTKAVSYLEMAFKNMTIENDLALELWFYRLAHFPAFYEQAKEKLDSLLADGYRSIGWNFEGNIQQAEKEGFQDINLLKQYAKKITE